MDVILYRVGRNLNRAYRTAASLGVERLLLLECPGRLRGPLFSARGRVELVEITTWPTGGILGLEPGWGLPLAAVDWREITAIAIGGESAVVPMSRCAIKAHIPTTLSLCLTVEAALAIALYEWRRFPC